MSIFSKDSKHPIFEPELLPVWCSLCLWEDFIKNSQCVFYLDNEAARGALVNGATTTPSGQVLIQEFVLREMNSQVRVWFSRVPTSSNIADKPSRQDIGELDAIGAWRDTICWSQFRTKLERLGSEDWGFNDGILGTFPDALLEKRWVRFSAFTRFAHFVFELSVWNRRVSGEKITATYVYFDIHICGDEYE